MSNPEPEIDVEGEGVAGVPPAKIDLLIGKVDELVTATKAGTEATVAAGVLVQQERDERVKETRLTRVLIAAVAVLLVAVAVVGGGLVWNRVSQNEIDCNTRNDARTDARSMSVAVADNTVRELDSEGVVDRGALAESNERVALTKYPPIAC